MVNLIESANSVQYMLQANDRIDNLTLGMMVNNDIEGIAPLRPIQAGNERYFKYELDNKVSLNEYLGEYVKRDRLLLSFYHIAVAIKVSTEYMINWTSFVLDMEHIYVEQESGKTYLICVPLLSVLNDGNTCNFFKNILFTVQFDEEENGDYVGRLITFLNPKTYTIDKFIYELENMLEIAHRQFDVYDDEPEEEEEEIAAGDIEEAIAADDEKVTDIGENASGELSDMAEKAGGEVSDITESVSEKLPDMAENVSEEVSGITENISEKVSDITENVSGEAAGATENVGEILPDSVENAAEAVADITGAIGEEAASVGATVSEKVTDTVENTAFLLRTRTNEKIVITKDKFCVGSDSLNVDYCVTGNADVEDIHAFIIKKGNEYFILDNNTRKGTFMNNVALIYEEGAVFLPHGAHLRFGSEEFDFKMHE